MKKIISTVFLILSILCMLGSFGMFMFSNVFTGTSLQKDVAFVGLIIASTLLFFLGQLIDLYTDGVSPSRFKEEERQSQIRSAFYGMIAGVAGLFLLVLASVLHS